MIEIPTTSGTGSEATDISIVTDTVSGAKLIVHDPGAAPFLHLILEYFCLNFRAQKSFYCSCAIRMSSRRAKKELGQMEAMDVHRRYKIHHWYNSEGQTVAYCHSHWLKGEDKEVIYAFNDRDPPIGRLNSASPLIPSFGTSDGSAPYDIEDHNTAEDFYWGDWAYFESLDDAEPCSNDHKN